MEGCVRIPNILSYNCPSYLEMPATMGFPVFEACAGRNVVQHTKRV